MSDLQRAYVPARTLNTPYPLIDSDPYVPLTPSSISVSVQLKVQESHFKRVCKYGRPSDYGVGVATALAGPALMLLWEKIAPSYVGRGGFAPIMRLTGVIGAGAGFLMFYTRSVQRFYGFEENKREVDMDMREMVDKVKRNEPLYGRSTMTPYMQGVASRNSRYSGVFLHVIPWFNFINHEQHGVDTAKYYQQAERELEAERSGSSSS